MSTASHIEWTDATWKPLGGLDPRSCESYMGYPVGWTESPHWAERSSRRSSK
jgi:protein gp37